MKARLKEMEDEAAKLRQMQARAVGARRVSCCGGAAARLR